MTTALQLINTDQSLPVIINGPNQTPQLAKFMHDEYTPVMRQEDAQVWIDRAQSVNRNQDFSRFLLDAKEAINVYENKHPNGEIIFNLLQQNVDVIRGTVMPQEPEPTARVIETTNDELNKALCRLADIKNVATQQVIDNGRFRAVMENAIEESLVAGMAAIRIHYLVVKGQPKIHLEMIPHNRLIIGPCDSWEQCPWVIQVDHVSNEELDLYLDDYMKANPFPAARDRWNNYNFMDPAWHRNRPGFTILQCWDRINERRTFVRMEDGMVTNNPYLEGNPYGLPGFLPYSRPLIPMKSRANSMIPIVPYTIFRHLHRMLNLAMQKYSSTLWKSELKYLTGLMTEQGKKFIEHHSSQWFKDPVLMQNMVMKNLKLEDMIYKYPIQDQVAFMQFLSDSAVQTLVNSIYQVTGISDIQRGATDAAETATAQKIKAYHNTVRIKSFHNNVKDATRDTFQIIGDMVHRIMGQDSFTLGWFTGQFLDPNDPVDANTLELLKHPDIGMHQIDVEADTTEHIDQEDRRKAAAEALVLIEKFFVTMQNMQGAELEDLIDVTDIYSSILDDVKPSRTTLRSMHESIRSFRKRLEQQLKQLEQPGAREAKKQMELQERMQTDPDLIKLQNEYQKIQGEFQFKQQELDLRAQELQNDRSFKQLSVLNDRTKIVLDDRFNIMKHNDDMLIAEWEKLIADEQLDLQWYAVRSENALKRKSLEMKQFQDHELDTEGSVKRIGGAL